MDNEAGALANGLSLRHCPVVFEASMTHQTQPDLFGDRQPDLFGTEAAPVSYKADPDRVRARLSAIIGQARAARTLPWDRAELRLYRTIVPQMVLWLPDEEARQWRLDFEGELERLHAA